ncbi:MAG: hypothetical protein HUK22_07400, partial [Thermoguttaceae bacterium]|nr:hypothetical protein [Thermoguttaceae bacterium]
SPVSQKTSTPCKLTFVAATTIGVASAAGVNLFVAGTGVFSAPDYGARIAALREIAKRAANE